MKAKLNTLQQKLGYTFNDINHLKTALTHKSACDQHYEKLEFLGDSILNYCISSLIFQQAHTLNEGKLSILRSKLVNKSNLSQLGIRLNLDTFIITKNQIISDSLRADVVEAIVGAIYLDAGIKACSAWIYNHFIESVLTLAKQDLKDPKSLLQELTHQLGKEHPKYQILLAEGEAHQIRFTISCQVNTHETQAQACTKRLAEKLAAEKMLFTLQDSTHE
jgi:ribonuclease-3